MHTLYLIRGCPGAGKSALAENLAYYMNIKFFEADMFFYGLDGAYDFDAAELHNAHRWCRERVEEQLQQCNSVIVSNTSTTEKEVSAYQDLAKRYNARFVSLVVENRHGNNSIHNVPPEKMEQMRNRFSVRL